VVNTILKEADLFVRTAFGLILQSTITAILKVKRRGVIVLKLYQSLTQVQINEQFAGQATGYKLSTALDKPLNYDPTILYQYLDTVLKPGSRHDENNLRYVTDPGYIGENFNYQSVPFTLHMTEFDEKMAFARKLVADLNRHLSVNIKPEDETIELVFVD
jgi:hypothetical protein